MLNEEQNGRIIPVWLGVAAELRRGEALALVWDDIDRKKHMLHIQKQYGKEKILKDPKTIRSRRTDSIEWQSVKFLSTWKRKQQAMLEYAGL